MLGAARRSGCVRALPRLDCPTIRRDSPLRACLVRFLIRARVSIGAGARPADADPTPRGGVGRGEELLVGREGGERLHGTLSSRSYESDRLSCAGAAIGVSRGIVSINLRFGCLFRGGEWCRHCRG
jgi:hypothetical protein